MAEEAGDLDDHSDGNSTASGFGDDHSCLADLVAALFDAGIFAQ